MGGELIGQANQVKQVGHVPKTGSHQRIGIRSHIRRQEGLDHANPWPFQLFKPFTGNFRPIQSFKPFTKESVGRVSWLARHKSRRPDDGGPSRLRLHENRPSQLFRMECSPNPIAAQRLPLDRCAKHGHLLLELRLLKPSQEEAQAEILLIGRKFNNARGGWIDHWDFKRYNSTNTVRQAFQPDFVRLTVRLESLTYIGGRMTSIVCDSGHFRKGRGT